MPDHSTSLSIEDHPIAEGLVAVLSPKDGDGLGVDLREDWVTPRREAWDINSYPCLCPQPEHLYGGQIATITIPAGNVDLVVSKSQG